MKNLSMKNILTRLFEYFFEVVEVDEDGHEIKKQQDSKSLLFIFLSEPIFFLKMGLNYIQ